MYMQHHRNRKHKGHLIHISLGHKVSVGARMRQMGDRVTKQQGSLRGPRITHDIYHRRNLVPNGLQIGIRHRISKLNATVNQPLALGTNTVLGRLPLLVINVPTKLTSFHSLISQRPILSHSSQANTLTDQVGVNVENISIFRHNNENNRDKGTNNTLIGATPSTNRRGSITLQRHTKGNHSDQNHINSHKSHLHLTRDKEGKSRHPVHGGEDRLRTLLCRGDHSEQRGGWCRGPGS